MNMPVSVISPDDTCLLQDTKTGVIDKILVQKSSNRGGATFLRKDPNM